MADHDIWRRRFAVFTAARVFGLLTLLAGVAIIFSDVLRPGGWPLVGGIIMILGLVDSIYAPILLKKHWAAEDKER
jgi:membrane-bound ClpP family serine protease